MYLVTYVFLDGFDQKGTLPKNVAFQGSFAITKVIYVAN